MFNVKNNFQFTNFQSIYNVSISNFQVSERNKNEFLFPNERRKYKSVTAFIFKHSELVRV
jgi:hypothetical protein